MKIYEFKRAPNPRRVQMFLVEKNIDVEYVQVNVRNGENRESDYLSIEISNFRSYETRNFDTSTTIGWEEITASDFLNSNGGIMFSFNLIKQF